jgi:hypothetical protein
MKNNVRHGFSIAMYLPTGDPEGFRIVSKSHWTGKGLVIPRSQFPIVKSEALLKAAGAYVLVGPVEERELPTIYVGEGDPVLKRLQDHYSKKDFWTWAVAFVSSDRTINKAHVEYLEARLVELATQAKRCILDNENTPTVPTLSEPEQADAESFLADMLSIYPILGINAFEKPVGLVSPDSDSLVLSAKGLKAQGYESGSEFVVKQGSQAALSQVPSIHQYMSTLRKDLVDNGVLVQKDGVYLFSQDYPFGSPSTAAGVILGRSANGRTEWKDASGRTLKEKQEAESSL